MSGVIFLILLSLAGANQTINLSLQDAIKIALENNRDIQIERKNLEISLGDVLAQKGIFDPVLNINSSYTDAKNPTASSFVPSGSINIKELAVGNNVTGTLPTGTFYNLFNFSLTRTTTDSPIETLSPNYFTNLSFSVGQNLLRNFGYGVNEAQIVVATRTSQISRKEVERRISDVLLSVETAYWNLAAAKENLELARTTLDLSKDLQRRNEIQVEVGTLPRVSVTQAKSEVASDEVSVINAENALRAAEDSLKNILAIPLVEGIVPTDEPTTALKPFDETDALREAEEKRPEIAEAQIDIKNKETLKGFFSNQRLPTLSVQGIATLQGLGGIGNPNRRSFGSEPPAQISDRFNGSYRDSFRNLFEGNFPAFEILGTFSFPIFNRTARGNYVKASADLDRSVIALKQTTENVALDVRNAVREVENSIRSIEATKTAVDLAQEVLGNQQERFKVGVGTTRDVLEAQRDLVNARTQQIQAITNYNIALAQLDRAKGTILETRNVKVKE